MLQKPYHGWRIKPDMTAIPTLSPRLPLPPFFFYCHCHTHNLPPPTSHFLFTSQTTTSPLSTSSLATGPSAAAAAAAAAAACYSPAPEPNPNTHFEHPNLNVESLRESHDEGREDDGEENGTPSDKLSLIFTWVSEDGTCKAYVVPMKYSSQESCGEKVEVFYYVHPGALWTQSFPADASMLEWLKRNPKVVNILEVYGGDYLRVVSEEFKKYGGKVMPADLLEQVANILEVYFGHGSRVAYEKAMRYAVRFMKYHFPLQVALCYTTRLSSKISLIESSLMFEASVFALDGPWKQQANPSRFSRLWRLCLLQLLKWIQSGVCFGQKKRNEMRRFCRISFGDGQGRQGTHKDRSHRDR